MFNILVSEIGSGTRLPRLQEGCLRRDGDNLWNENAPLGGLLAIGYGCVRLCEILAV